MNYIHNAGEQHELYPQCCNVKCKFQSPLSVIVLRIGFTSIENWNFQTKLLLTHLVKSSYSGVVGVSLIQGRFSKQLTLFVYIFWRAKIIVQNNAVNIPYTSNESSVTVAMPTPDIIGNKDR